MSDKRITLSCGYRKDADDLDQAQDRKLDLVCRKIGLKPGDRVLDMAAASGSFARFAAGNDGCAVTGIDLSGEQIQVAGSWPPACPDDRAMRLPGDAPRIWRTPPSTASVSIGMFEHVGYKNFRAYMESRHTASGRRRACSCCTPSD